MNRKRARMRARFIRHSIDRLAFTIELAFLGHPLERLPSALDPVLMFVAFRRQKLDDLERAARAETAKWAGCVANVLTDRIFVNFQQRSLPSRRLNHPTTAFNFC